MKNLKKSLCVLLSALIVFGLFTIIPLTAGAADSVDYIDENGEEKTAENVTELTAEYLADNNHILHDGWYAVKSDLEISNRINAAGDVKLILCDDCTFTAHKGITVPKAGVTRSLTVYAQSKDADEMGALVIDSPDQNQPGIGNYSIAYGHGNITVNGGKLTVSGGSNAAGIGGGNRTESSGVVINGGIVSATGGANAAGIGGGYNGGCDVVINGGTVNALGGTGAAGVGSGYLSDTKAKITVTGGAVNAAGASGGAGIGSGRIGSGSSYALDSDCDVTISGGTVTATGGGTGAGVGGGWYSKGAVTITGGTVKAYKGAGSGSSGVGNGAGVTGSTITLSWTNTEKDNYYADNYGGTVTLQKYFTDRNTEIYTPGEVTDNGMIGAKTIYPCQLTAKKVWDVGGNDSLHPTSVKTVLQVYQSPGNDQPKEWTTRQTLTLSEDNNWEADFSDVTSSGGKSALARMRELDAQNKPVDPDSDVVFSYNRDGKNYKLGYHATYTFPASGQLTVTNKLDVHQYKIEKKWDIDLEGKDRPESIDVIVQTGSGSNWKEEQIFTLNKDNEWKSDYVVPKYRYSDNGGKQEITYRFREMREQSFYNQFMTEIKDLVTGGKATYDEWTDKLRTEANDVYLMLPDDIRSALDDSYESLCSALGVADDAVNELYDKLMEVLERESSGNRIVHDKDDGDKGEKETANRVTYNVSGYNSVVSGGEVSNHATTYKVKYDADGDNITITNQAIQIINMYKHWIKINVDDEDMPDSAWLVLMVKPSSGAVENAGQIASAAGVDLSDILDYDFPVIAPLEGGMGPFEILGEAILGVNLSWLDDLFDLPHVGITKVDEDCKWKSTIIDTKYTLGIPKEFRGAELTGEIIHQLIKYLTDGVIDLPISYNPFSNYITISTKAIPQLRWMSLDDIKNDLSWDRLVGLGKTLSQKDLDDFKPQDLIFDKSQLMTNIINVKFKIGPDPDPEDDDGPLKGSKVWAGDDESKRPDWIKIHVKDGGEEIAGSPIVLNKSSFSGSFVWSWSLELEEGVEKSQLTITEEYPADYAYKDNYTATVIGTMIVNKWSGSSNLTNINGRKIWKDDRNTSGKRPDEITVNLLADGEKVASATVTASNSWSYVFADQPIYKTEGGSQVKIVYTVTEEPVENYTASYDGYNIINTLTVPDPPQYGKLKITATRPASADAKEQSFIYQVTGDSVDLTVAIVLEAGETSADVTVAQLPTGQYTVTEEADWSWRYSDGGSRTADVSDDTAEAVFDHTLENEEWLNGYSHRYD